MATAMQRPAVSTRPERTGRRFAVQPTGRFQPNYVPAPTEISLLQQQVEELLQSVLSPEGAADGIWVPNVDIEETDDAWVIEAEVPGVNKKDVNVEVRDNEIVITGEIKERERKGIIRRRTRRVGEFEFRATLPGDADADNIKADVDDGLLTVRVPKQDQAESRQIEVTSGSADGNGASRS
jgi:HSP20 family protein